MSKKVLTGAMAAVMATGMVTPVMAETNETKTLAELHVAAFEAYKTAMKAAEDKESNATVQKLINEARKASAAFLAAYEAETGSNEHNDIPTWSTGLDSIQHPILARIIEEVVDMDENTDTITQERLNEVYSLLWNDLEDDTDNLAEEYLIGEQHGLSQAYDNVQQKFVDIVYNAVLNAESEKTAEAVEVADALIKELSTALSPSMKEAAKNLEEQLSKVEVEESLIKVEYVSAITETSIAVTFADGVEVTNEDLENKTITLKAGETTLTATYASSSLAGSIAVFELSEESKLVDAVKYTVTADWTKFINESFVAEIGTAYAKTFTAITTKVYETVSPHKTTILNIKAQDQYGEEIDVPTTLDFEGSTLNGMPIDSDLSVTANGKVTLQKSVKSGDVLVIKVSNIDSEDKLLGTATFDYIVEKVEEGFDPTAPNSIESIKAIDENGETVTKFAATDVVILSANVLDHASNPVEPNDSQEKQVRWVVKEGKNLLESTNTHTGVVGQELGSDVTTLDLAVGKTPTFKIKSSGTIVIEAYNISNGAKASYTINAGAQELKTLTYTSKNTTGNNKEDLVLGKIEQNSGSTLSKTDLKFRVLDNKGKETTKATVKAVVAGKNDPTTYDEGTIYLVANTTEAGAYTVVPYVGSSFDDTKTIKASPVAFETALNATAVSIDTITLPTLKIGTPVITDLTIKNKHGENIVSELDLDNDVKAVVYKDGAIVENEPVTVTYEYDSTTKTAKAKFVAKKEGNYTVRLSVKNTAAVTDVVVKSEKTDIASINLGSDIYDIISGDKDVYRTITVKDNKGDIILPKIGTEDGEISLSKHVEDVSLVYVAKDSKGNWTTTTEEKAEAVAIKFEKGIKQTSTALDIKVRVNNSKAVTIEDTLKVSVKEARKIDKVTVNQTSLTIGLNGKTTITVNTIDQYGAAYTASASELAQLKIIDTATGSEKVTVLTSSGTEAEKVKDNNDKVVGYKFEVIGTKIGNTSLQVKSGDVVKATINATVAEVVDVISSISFEGEEFNEDGTYKYKIDADSTNDKFDKFVVVGKDASGNEVAIDTNKVTWTTSNTSILEYNEQDEKFEIKKAVEKDTIVTVTADLYGKKVSVDLVLSSEKSKLLSNTLAVKEAEVVDADSTKDGIQIALDGDNKDGEVDGTITLTFTGKDQYGKDIDNLSSVLSFKESIATVSKDGTQLTIVAASKGSTQVRATVDDTDFLIDVTVTDKALEDKEEATKRQVAQSIVAALFKDETKVELATDVNQDAINAAKAKVDLVAEGEVKESLKNDINLAQVLLNNKLEAEYNLQVAQSIVAALFKDETKAELATGINQDAINAAKAKVDLVAEGEVKESLKNDINTAQTLLDQLNEVLVKDLEFKIDILDKDQDNKDILKNGQAILQAKKAYDSLSIEAKSLMKETSIAALNNKVNTFKSFTGSQVSGLVAAVSKESDKEAQKLLVNEAEINLNTAKELGMANSEYNHYKNMIDSAKAIINTL